MKRVPNSLRARKQPKRFVRWVDSIRSAEEVEVAFSFLLVEPLNLETIYLPFNQIHLKLCSNLSLMDQVLNEGPFAASSRKETPEANYGRRINGEGNLTV